jgi:RNA polymerase sigma factor (TIGR02999 family)
VIVELVKSGFLIRHEILTPPVEEPLDRGQPAFERVVLLLQHGVAGAAPATIPAFPMADITDLLNQWREGDPVAFDELVPRVYGEMKAIASRLLRNERPGQLLDTGALVHEAYLRLVDQTRINWSGRAHFFGAAANAMRRILVDQARRRLAGKRGGGARHEDLEVAVQVAIEPDLDVLALNEALNGLGEVDAGLARLVEMRYFAGLSVDETAEMLGVTPQAVSRDWTVARAWLSRRLGGPARPDAPPESQE